nr:ribonuclease H-like domain-containing protein [Tanacetum cinerariifolium]
MQKRRNDVKARTNLLLALPDEHQLRFSKYKAAQELWAAILKTFGGNEATKKTKKNQLKQQYGNFKAEGSETLEQTFNRLQAIVSHLEFMDVEIEQDDLNQKYWKKTRKKISIQGTDVAGFDKSKVECFNCHKMGHFARECRAPRSQDRGRRENFKQGSKVEESAPKALMMIDGVGWDWSYMANEEEDHALVRSQDRGRRENFKQGSKVEESDPKALMMIDGVGWDWSYMANEEEDHALVADQEAPTEFAQMAKSSSDTEVESKTNRIESLSNELEMLKKEKEGLDSKRTGFKSASKDLDTLLGSQRKFPTSNSKVSTADLGNKGKAVMASAYWIWMPKQNSTNKGPNSNSVSVMFKKYTYIDAQGRLNGCSRHMTGNISYLSYYEPYDEGYVSFGQGGCKITSKGTIKTGKLEFENVYFVKDLKYNLVSVSQIYDNKNSVLFTDSECFVLGRDFKLRDDTDVLLRTPIQHNMYYIDLNNIVSHKDLTCLVAKASADESELWHRRLGHLNFKIMNRVLVNKSQNKTPCELFNGRTPAIGFLKPFGCHVMILNTLDHLGKFEAKGDEGTKEAASQNVSSLRYIAFLNWFLEANLETSTSNAQDACKADAPDSSDTNRVSVEADLGNLENNISASPTPTFRIHKDHPTRVGLAEMLYSILPKSASTPFESSVFVVTPRKFEAKGDEEFLENKLIEKRAGPNWLLDIDTLTNSMNYVPVVSVGTTSTNFSGTKDAASQDVKKDVSSLRYISLPNWFHKARLESSISNAQYACEADAPESSGNSNPTATSTNPLADQIETLKVETPIPTLCREFEALMHEKFQTSAMDVKSANTPMDKENPWGKDGTSKDVDLHLYRSTIGSLTYLTSSRPNIMFAVCACARHQVTPKECHLHAVKRIFRYLKEYVAAASGCRQVLRIQNQQLDYGLVFCDYHNMVAILEKYEHNANFHQIVDFVEAFHLRIETTDEGTKILATVDGRTVPLYESMLVTMGEGSGTPTEPYHTPSPEAPQSPQHDLSSSIHLPSSALPTAADEPVYPLGDDSQCEACPTVSGLKVEHDRANILKTSTLPHDSPPRVPSLAADEGSMQHKLNALTDLCTSLQRIKMLEDKDGGGDEPSGEDATIKGRSLEIGEEAVIERRTDKGSNDIEEMVNVLTSLDETSILTSGVQVSVPPTVSIPPACEILTVGVPTGSGVVPTASPVFTTTTVSTPYSRRKEEEMARDAQRMNEQISLDAEIARIHAEEELQMMIFRLDRSNEMIAKHLHEYEQAAAELTIGEKIELINEQTKHFKGMSLEEIREKFVLVWKQIEDFVPMSSKEEGERFKRKGLRLDQESAKKVNTSEEVSEEVLKTMMQLVLVEEVYVEALHVKHPIIDWEIHTEGQRSYWKIIRMGGSTTSYQIFVDMTKHFDMEDLNQL